MMEQQGSVSRSRSRSTCSFPTGLNLKLFSLLPARKGKWNASQSYLCPKTSLLDLDLQVCTWMRSTDGHRNPDQFLIWSSPALLQIAFPSPRITLGPLQVGTEIMSRSPCPHRKTFRNNVSSSIHLQIFYKHPVRYILCPEQLAESARES